MRRALLVVLVVAAVMVLAQARLSDGELPKPPKPPLIYYVK